MTSARTVLLLAGLATVLLCAHAAWAGPNATGQVTLSVEPYVDIWIPQGPSHFPAPYADAWYYPLLQEDGVTEGVTPDRFGSRETMSTTLEIYATANCPVWVRVPDLLLLQDHGAYTAGAQVTLADGRTIPPPVKSHTGPYYYAKFGSGIAAGSHILNAVVSIHDHTWSLSDPAGVYWGTLFADILASNAGWATTPNPAQPGFGWPTHEEPNYPPHDP